MNTTNDLLYDPALVGPRIGSGADRVVYAYGNNQVIKFSSFAWLGGSRVKQKFIHDFQACIQYFGDFVVPVTVVSKPTERKLIEIQPKMVGVPLTKEHLVLPGVLQQVEKIYEGLLAMEQIGLAPVDLIGRSGWLRDVVENIWVDDQHRLHILDTALLETKSAGLAGYLLAPFMPIARARQKHIFKKWLGLLDTQ